MTTLPEDPTLSTPDVGRGPVSGAPVDAVGAIVLLLAVTTPEGAKTMLEPEETTVGTAEPDDAGWAVREPSIEL